MNNYYEIGHEHELRSVEISRCAVPKVVKLKVTEKITE